MIGTALSLHIRFEELTSFLSILSLSVYKFRSISTLHVHFFPFSFVVYLIQFCRYYLVFVTKKNISRTMVQIVLSFPNHTSSFWECRQSADSLIIVFLDVAVCRCFLILKHYCCCCSLHHNFNRLLPCLE